MINRDRLLKDFLELVTVDGPSRRESEVAAVLRRKLEDLGLTVEFDAAGEKVGSNTDNLIAFWPAHPEGDEGRAPNFPEPVDSPNFASEEETMGREGQLAQLNSESPASRKGRPRKPIFSSELAAPSLFFSCHLDTVEPTAGLKPQVKGDIISSDGQTILGADDRAGMAILLEALRVIKEAGFPHGPVEIVATVGEEIGLLGAKHLDFGKLQSRMGYVLDSGDRPGTAVVKAPTEADFTITVHGRAAHAGVEPEKGVNAIAVAAQSITQIPMGRIDPETTVSIGLIKGGKATNIVPDLVEMQGEVRSMREERVKELLEEIRRIFRETAQAAEATVEMRWEIDYHRFAIPPEAPVVQLFQTAAKRSALQAELVTRGGGSDANIFNEHGLQTLNLGLGMQGEHTHGEHISLSDMAKAAQLVVEIIRAAASQGMPRV
ncbi:MAG: M20/M25/M40 family metallo-hydrolase [Firmicutes bacterium]|nr:M20/M25/M40 family metallo-hydrolase [Bacillota bacterium]